MKDAYRAYLATDGTQSEREREAKLAGEYGVSGRTIRRWIKRGKVEQWDKVPIRLAERRRA